MTTEDLLKEITEARGPSGFETEIRELAADKLAAFSDEVRADVMGNLIALKRGDGEEPRASVMLTAHMDEIALMVTGKEKGFLRVTQIGGFDARVLIGQRVTVHGRREMPGLVVSVPPHFTKQADREKPVPLDRLFVDVGLPPSEVDALIGIGDPITLRASFTPLAGGYASSKSMDDRAGLAAIVLALEELGRRRHAWDVCVLATVQEEENFAGAVTGAYHLEPTLAIAVDGTFGQQPGFSTPETAKMDAGPSIALGPNIHPRIHDRLAAAAKAADIPYQLEAQPGNTDTDAWPIQVSRSGIPTGLLGIPIRYMHTAVETVALRDIERTARLLAEFVSRLDAGFAETLSTRDALEERREGGQSCC
jgi:putative aminopeptidase FrvX